jgi:hypothetical protein
MKIRVRGMPSGGAREKSAGRLISIPVKAERIMVSPARVSTPQSISRSEIMSKMRYLGEPSKAREQDRQSLECLSHQVRCAHGEMHRKTAIHGCFPHRRRRLGLAFATASAEQSPPCPNTLSAPKSSLRSDLASPPMDL